MSASAATLRLAPSARPRRQPLPRRAVPRARPAPLRVVDVAARRRAPRVRRVLWCFGAMLVCSLIAAVCFHAVVAQSQLEIDQLRREVGDQQHRYEQSRLEVAQLSSPPRIVTRAQEMGMVAAAETPTPVAVPGASAPVAPASSDSTATTLAESWPKVKQYLDAQP